MPAAGFGRDNLLECPLKRFAGFVGFQFPRLFNEALGLLGIVRFGGWLAWHGVLSLGVRLGGESSEDSIRLQ